VSDAAELLRPAGSGRPIRAAGAVVYRRAAAGYTAVLLIRKRTGLWTLPKGRIKRGETAEDAVLREVAEETGVRGAVQAEVARVRYVTPRRRPPREKQVTYFLVRALDGVLSPNAAEAIVRVRWFTLRAAWQRIGRQRVRQVLRQASRLLAGLAPG
jgi:8-oxo-dGTP diphosphatase